MFKFLALLALLAVAVYAGPLTRPNARGFPLLQRLNGRIINGTATSIEENPHQISIVLSAFGHLCGGSIISKYWVLTAAHCIGSVPSEINVSAGTSNMFVGGSLHRVKRVIPHEKFHYTKMGMMVHDIGLIELKDGFKFDETRKPVHLYSKDEVTVPGLNAVITGWGETGNGYPDILRRAVVPIISKKQCNKLYQPLNGISDGQICAVYENGGKDACQGDSGGPLTIYGRLAGIVSWGIGCAAPGYPGVYTEVAYYRDWIRKHSGV